MTVSIVYKLVGALIRLRPSSVALENLFGRGCLKPKVFKHRGTFLLEGNEHDEEEEE